MTTGEPTKNRIRTVKRAISTVVFENSTLHFLTKDVLQRSEISLRRLFFVRRFADNTACVCQQCNNNQCLRYGICFTRQALKCIVSADFSFALIIVNANRYVVACPLNDNGNDTTNTIRSNSSVRRGYNDTRNRCREQKIKYSS